MIYYIYIYIYIHMPNVPNLRYARTIPVTTSVSIRYDARLVNLLFFLIQENALTLYPYHNIIKTKYYRCTIHIIQGDKVIIRIFKNDPSILYVY